MGYLQKIRETIEESLNQQESGTGLAGLDVNQLLLEAGFHQYRALIRVTYNTDPEKHMTASKVEELLRGAPGGTRVTAVSTDRAAGTAIYRTRVVSQKSPKECFIAFKRTCMDRYKGMILNVEVGAGTIEETGTIG